MVYFVAAPDFLADGSELAQNLPCWIAAAARGDQMALAHLYDGTSRIVYGLILRIVTDPAAAEDVLLEVYLQVWRQAQTFDLRGKPLSWLLMIARSRALDALRSRAAKEASQQQPLEQASTISDPAPSPEECSALAQRRILVQSALSALPPEQREVIELAFFSGLSHAEIADRLGCPLGTVKTRIRLAMARLRSALGPYAEGV